MSEQLYDVVGIALIAGIVFGIVFGIMAGAAFEFIGWALEKLSAMRSVRRADRSADRAYDALTLGGDRHAAL